MLATNVMVFKRQANAVKKSGKRAADKIRFYLGALTWLLKAEIPGRFNFAILVYSKLSRYRADSHAISSILEIGDFNWIYVARERETSKSGRSHVTLMLHAAIRGRRDFRSESSRFVLQGLTLDNRN